MCKSEECITCAEYLDCATETLSEMERALQGTIFADDETFDPERFLQRGDY